MMQHFWDRWHQEYLTTMINRSKWLIEKRNFKIGDIVIVNADNLPPMKWKLGKVEDVLPGKDNLVRSVVIGTANGVYKRPIVKLGLFIENNNEN